MPRKLFKKILIFFPTHLGDTGMCLPALNRLRANHPIAQITVIASPVNQSLLVRNSFVDNTILFDKHWPLIKKIKFYSNLIGKFDCLVDFKNSFLPIALLIKNHTPFIRRFPAKMTAHERFLQLVKKLAPIETTAQSSFLITEEEKIKWDNLALPQTIFIAVCANSSTKRYAREQLKEIVEKLLLKYPVAILGSNADRGFYQEILIIKNVINLIGKTSMPEVFYLLKKYAKLLIAVDSGIMHLASYANIPVLGLYGPTDWIQYGPWSEKSAVVTNTVITCAPCLKSGCRLGTSECMKISAEKVINAAEKLLNDYT
jgi:ADP-heptose:LPS heptosyltransferase